MSTKESDAPDREEQRVYTKADLDAAIKIWKGEASKPELEPHKPRRERTPTRRAWIRSQDGEEGRVHSRSELDDIIKRLEGEASKRETSPRRESTRMQEPAHKSERPTPGKAGRVVGWLVGMGVLAALLLSACDEEPTFTPNFNGDGYELVVNGEYVDSWTANGGLLEDRKAGCEALKRHYLTTDPTLTAQCRYVNRGTSSGR